MKNFFVLEETSYSSNKKFDFDRHINNGFDSPYCFSNYFKNINYDRFVKNISDIMNYRILQEEFTFLKKYYGKKIINNKYKINTLLRKKKYLDFIENLIITKRIEFLQEYIIDNSFNTIFLEYTQKLINSLYNNINYNKQFII